MTEHSAEDKARVAKCRDVAMAVMRALEPFKEDGPSVAVIGTAVALGSVIAVSGDPNLAYMRATKTMRGIMDGDLLD